MGLEEQDRRGRLIDLPRLDSDQPILEVVDAPDAVFAPDPVQSGDQVDRSDRLAVKRNRQPLLESNLDVSRLVRTVAWIARP